MQKRKKYSRTAHHKENASSYRPAISLAQAQISFFISSGKAYSIATTSDTIFKEAVLQLAPNWTTHETYAPILEDEMDIYTRWFLLCSLADSERGMKTYTEDELRRTQSVCDLIL